MLVNCCYVLASRIPRILGHGQLEFYVMKSPPSHDAELIEYRFWDLQAFYLKVFAPPLKRSHEQNFPLTPMWDPLPAGIS